MSSPSKPSAFLKPTLKTKFHIDYGWWERSEHDLRAYILTHLPPEQQEHFRERESERVIDHVDMETGEITRLDELGMALQEATTQPDFINMQTSLVDSVFRVFLANGNKPMTPAELAEATQRDANTILKTFGGIKVYRGIRPFSTADEDATQDDD